MIGNSFIFIQADNPAVELDEEAGILRVFPVGGDEQATVVFSTLDAARLIARIAEALAPGRPESVVHLSARRQP